MNNRKNQIVQVFRDGQWENYSKPCTLKLAVWIMLDKYGEALWGKGNSEPNPDWSPLDNPGTGPNDYRIVTISEFKTMKKSSLAIRK